MASTGEIVAEASNPGSWSLHKSLKREHAAQFYEEDTFLVEAVVRFIGAALGAGDAAIVIATPPHQIRLAEHLQRLGLDLERISTQGRFFALDAAETLSRILVDGWPDEHRFAEVVGATVARASTADGLNVRVFGEMVALLWAAGQREAVLRIEQLWDDLAETVPFSLLCGYRLADFSQERDGQNFLRICGAHSHVIPAESYTGLARLDQRSPSITELREKAHTLETEIARRQEAEAGRRSHERRAAELQASLAAIVESSDDAIVGKTLDGTVTTWNAGAARIFGYTAEEMIGQSIGRLVPPDRQDDLPIILGAIRRGEYVEHFETERIRKDGRRVHVSLSVSPIRDADGRIVGASKIARDVTERKGAEAAKDEFLAMLGHELRNPLAAVQSAITAASLDPTRRERALDIARRQAGQLRRLVDDLLDVARIARGKIALRKERLSLSSVVERAIETARPMIDERGHTLRISLPADIQIDVDAGRIEQVLVNLLTNAAKFTLPGGRIELNAELSGTAVVLSVRDNGIGISAETLPRVFDIFSQGAQSPDRASGGLGLGLALVKRLVELHGGRVTAHSDGCGHGAEIVVRLPAAHGPEPEQTGLAEATAERQMTKLRVLIAEDNVDAADSLAMLLEIVGHTVDTAHDGIAALDMMERIRPNVMLVDIGLPGIDGFEVARRARALPSGKDTLLIALTGYGRDEDKERTREAGFDYHLTKPVELDQLKLLVAGDGSTQRPSRTTAQ